MKQFIWTIRAAFYLWKKTAFTWNLSLCYEYATNLSEPDLYYPTWHPHDAVDEDMTYWD